MLLHGYWRSTASYRVRIALNLKGLGYEQATHDLRTGAQRSQGFRALNPQGLVPALEVDGHILTQSPAILEWLEERYPEPRLLPEGPDARATVRAFAAIIACDIHPLNNLRVLNALRSDFQAGAESVNGWIARWIAEGFVALEAMVSSHGGDYAFGDTPTLADCLLVPQVYSAERFGVDLAPFPNLAAAAAHARSTEPFRAAHPDAQPDADRA